VSFRAIVDSLGGPVAGSLTDSSKLGTGDYRVKFPQSVEGCTLAATLARVPGGLVVDPPPGRITVAETGDEVRVHTYGADGTADDSGFHLLVVCD
jgi:hypothetical protein